MKLGYPRTEKERDHDRVIRGKEKTTPSRIVPNVKVTNQESRAGDKTDPTAAEPESKFAKAFQETDKKEG